MELNARGRLAMGFTANADYIWEAEAFSSLTIF
jgi:hypothetical protein